MIFGPFHALLTVIPTSTVLAAPGLASGPTAQLSVPGLWLTGLERTLILIGLTIALGGLAGRGLARQYKGTTPVPLPEPWAVGGCLLGLAGSASLIVTALAGPGLAANLSHPLVPGPRSNATLLIAAVELALFAAAALLLRSGKSNASVPLIGVVLAEAVRAHPEGLLPLAGALLTICHVLPAVTWAGMLVYVLRTAIAWRAHPAEMHGLLKLYGNAAAWLFALVIVTGIVSALLLVPVNSLLTTAYGGFVIAKAALVAIAAALAVAGRLSLRRRTRSGIGPTRATKVEGAVLGLVLLVTGVLTVITPPAKSAFTSGSASSSVVISHNRNQ